MIGIYSLEDDSISTRLYVQVLRLISDLIFNGWWPRLVRLAQKSAQINGEIAGKWILHPCKYINAGALASVSTGANMPSKFLVVFGLAVINLACLACLGIFATSIFKLKPEERDSLCFVFLELAGAFGTASSMNQYYFGYAAWHRKSYQPYLVVSANNLINNFIN